MTRSLRLLPLAALLTCAVVLAIAPVATADSLELGVQDLDASRYPDVTLRLTVPPQMTEGATDEPAFSIRENGKEAELLSATAVEGGSQEVVLVLDASGSMRGEPLDDAKAAALRFLEVVDPDARVAVVVIDSQPRLLSGFTADRMTLGSSILSLNAGGASAIYDALAIAVSAPSLDAGAHRTVVLLSDGSDKGSVLSHDAALRSLRAANVSVLAVSLTSPESNQKALSLVADQTGGRLVRVTDSSELAASFEAVAEEISNRYEVSFRGLSPRTKDIELDIAAEASGRTASAATVMPNPMLETLGATAEAAYSGVVRSDPLLLAGVALAAFGCVGLAFFGLVTLVVRQRTGMEQLHFYDQLKTGAPRGSHSTEVLRAKVFDTVGTLAGKRGYTAFIHERLERAGLPLRPVEFITGHALAVTVAGVIVQLLVGDAFVAVLVVVLATVGPLAFLSYKASSRVSAFEQQLPDVLTLIAGSLRAGWGMQQAIDHVVQEALPPASVEFRRVQTEARLGMPLEHALQGMADRFGSKDFEWVVASIAVQREVGGNLAEVLDIVAETVRERASLRRHVSGLTAEGRLSAIILFALPFVEALFLSLVNPGYMSRLAAEPLGVVMIGGALLLMLVGGVWLKNVTQVEV